MAAIVQSDPYQSLSRKIGYSVGLEFLLRNVKALTNLYAKDADVSYATWKQLVHESFGRSDRAVAEIANVFGALNLIRVIGRELHVLYALDALSILRRLFSDDEASFDRALRVVLMQQVLEADGDIFLNCVHSGFERRSCAISIREMINWKVDKLNHVIKNPALRSKIRSIVSIQSSPANSGGTTSGASARPSPFVGRREPLGFDAPKEIVVPDSYLEKILPTRKGWAQDLGFFDGDGPSALSVHLLSLLPNIGIGVSGGPYFFWPYARDLAQLRIAPDVIGAKSLTDWDLLLCIAQGFGAFSEEAFIEGEELDSLMAETKRVFELYRSGSKSRGSIRHQLPLYVAKPVCVAKAVAEQRNVPPLPAAIAFEVKGTRRLVSVTHIRGTEGALVFR